MELTLQATEEGQNARAKIIDAIMLGMEESLDYLHGRWLDERDHEDFAEYEDLMRSRLAIVAPYATVIKTSKRPFGITFRLPNFPYDVRLSVTCTIYSWSAESRGKGKNAA